VNFIALIVSLFFVVYSSSSVFADDEKTKTVLVTGASSGIGLTVTELLSSNGYLVYAGARKEEDLKRLEAMENVESVRLDVTVQADIDAAVKLIKNKGRGLDGLVNNAGIASAGPLIEVPIAELESLFDVNVYGPYRVTQAFAPLLIESKGRIVNIGSVTGIFSGSMSGIYSMSKHAVEAYTDSLAAEMERFGVKVSVVEPGTYASDSAKSAAKRLENKAIWSDSSAYKAERDLMKLVKTSDTSAKDPEEVAKAVQDALFSETPKRRYLVVPDAATANLAIGSAMQKMLQLNQDQAFTMNRDQLVRMLDTQLKKLQ
jgi:NAD(P)-dependent dehydrogenase (short-subunit alcohol dehydrogenase family)